MEIWQLVIRIVLSVAVHLMGNKIIVCYVISLLRNMKFLFLSPLKNIFSLIMLLLAVYLQIWSNSLILQYLFPTFVLRMLKFIYYSTTFYVVTFYHHYSHRYRYILLHYFVTLWCIKCLAVYWMITITTPGFHLLSAPRVKTRTGIHGFSVPVPTLWNSLSEHVKSSSSIFSFRHHLKIIFSDLLIPPKFSQHQIICWKFCIIPWLWDCLTPVIYRPLSLIL